RAHAVPAEAGMDPRGDPPAVPREHPLVGDRPAVRVAPGAPVPRPPDRGAATASAAHDRTAIGGSGARGVRGASPGGDRPPQAPARHGVAAGNPPPRVSYRAIDPSRGTGRVDCAI